MPLVSQAQRKWMWATHPKMAKKWESETPDKKLPEKVDSLPGDEEESRKRKFKGVVKLLRGK